MNVSIVTKMLPEPTEYEVYEAAAFTKGYGIRRTGVTEASALRKLQEELRNMYRFARIARTQLELKMGYHNCRINIESEQEDEN